MICYLIRRVAFICCIVLIQTVLPSIQTLDDRRMWRGGGGLGEHSLCLPDISDGVFIFTGSSEILLNSSLWALRSSLSFNPPTLHYPLPSFVFIKFCLTGGRSDKIVYEKLAVSVASVLVVTMYVLICLCEGYLVIM